MRIKVRIPQSEFEELVRPKLKLFLSVDVVGSTSFKQKDKDAHAQTWLNLFVSFFSEFPTLLIAQVASQNKKLVQPRLWKSLGDELIFTVELKDRHHAGDYLKAFAIALRKAAENWHADVENPARKELNLKGTAWLAGFPVGNVEIPLDADVDVEQSDGRDYIGPLIDTGFRLKEFASSRKLVLSADLAYFVLAVGVSGMEFFFDGEQTLKGVLRSKPYPIIWFDCDGHPEAAHTNSSAQMNRLKDVLSRCEPAKPESLKAYLRLWLEVCSSSLCIPFIYQDQIAELKPANDYEDKRERAKADLQGLFHVEDNGSSSFDGRGSPKIPKEATALLDRIAPKSRSRPRTKPTSQESLSKIKIRPAKKAVASRQKRTNR